MEHKTGLHLTVYDQYEEDMKVLEFVVNDTNPFTVIDALQTMITRACGPITDLGCETEYKPETGLYEGFTFFYIPATYAKVKWGLKMSTMEVFVK